MLRRERARRARTNHRQLSAHHGHPVVHESDVRLLDQRNARRRARSSAVARDQGSAGWCGGARRAEDGIGDREARARQDSRLYPMQGWEWCHFRRDQPRVPARIREPPRAADRPEPPVRRCSAVRSRPKSQPQSGRSRAQHSASGCLLSRRERGAGDTELQCSRRARGPRAVDRGEAGAYRGAAQPCRQPLRLRHPRRRAATGRGHHQGARPGGENIPCLADDPAIHSRREPAVVGVPIPGVLRCKGQLW